MTPAAYAIQCTSRYDRWLVCPKNTAVTTTQSRKAALSIHYPRRPPHDVYLCIGSCRVLCVFLVLGASPDSLPPDFLATRQNSGPRIIPSRPWKLCAALAALMSRFAAEESDHVSKVVCRKFPV